MEAPSSNILILALTVTAIITAVTVTGLSAFLATYLRDKSKSRYDEERHRADLSEMRKSYEDKISALTLQLTATDQRWKEINHLLISSQIKNTNVASPVAQNDFFESLGLRDADLTIDPKLVLLLTPFGLDHDESYQAVVESCRRVGLNCMRGDETAAHGDILTHILRIMARARIVIANIGSRNPNVYYELGIAHALDKPTILISETLSDIPFDVQSKRILIFRNTNELQAKLPEMLARLLATPEKPDDIRKPKEIKRSFVAFDPGDGIGLMRGRADYLCMTDDGEAIFLPAGPYLYLRLLPLYEQAPLTGVETFSIAQRHLRPIQGHRTSINWSLGRHETGAVAFFKSPTLPAIALDAAQLFSSKELWANDFYFLDASKERVKEIGFPFIPTGAVEEVLVDTLKNFLRVARDHLGVAPPVQIEAGLVGVQSYRLAVDERSFGSSRFEGRIVRNAIFRKITLDDWPARPADVLRPLFEDIYDAAGIKRPNVPITSRTP